MYNDENIFLSIIKSDENNRKIYYNDKPLKFVHTHFIHNDDVNIKKFNDIIMQYFEKAKMYEIIEIINTINTI
jgi:hypothetical protein